MVRVRKSDLGLGACRDGKILSLQTIGMLVAYYKENTVITA